MKTLGQILLAVSVITLICMCIPAVPLAWYSWLGISLITLFTGAAILGNEDKQSTLNRAGRRAQKRAQR